MSVHAGDWIGVMGGRGQATGPHIHVEVYEWFPKLDDGEGNGPIIPAGEGRWERINPGTLFPSSWMTDDSKDGAASIMQCLTPDQQKKYFRAWGATEEAQ